MAQIVPLIILFPAVGAFINIFWGSRMEERQSALVGILASTGAFFVALTLYLSMAGANYQEAVVNPFLFDSWILIESAGINIPWQMRVDTLSITMMLVVTGVGSLIHVYAMGYMHGDAKFSRFFAYLNMFLVFMLVLVTGNNLLMLFVGWEGVGLCSYLLIGFWYDKPHGEGWKNSNAARKAFIANRVGDFGLLMAMFLTFWTFGTLDFYKPGEVVNDHALTGAAFGHVDSHGDESHGEEDHGEGEDDHAAAFVLTSTLGTEEGDHGADDHGEEAATVYTNNDHLTDEQLGIFGQAIRKMDAGEMVAFGPFEYSIGTVLTIITLFMLLGAAGKSAQIPLFVWLPDAMAGPTPVSALIHAATMVTAGVYMIVRSNVFFYFSPLTSFIVAIIGAATALMAGFIAVGQWDIKRVLAYSTVSQLGFMVAAAGIGAYVAAIFHLVTHAFFKALLFLGSGSVIHGVEHGHHHAHEHGHDHDDAGHHGEGEDAHDFDPQDMRNMGGLATKMPITFITYLMGTLALAGIFPFAGFWSKDEILAEAWLYGLNPSTGSNLQSLAAFIVLPILLLAAGFTAFYMWRQMELVFFGDPRTEAAEQAPESVPAMTIPLAVLAFFALGIGFMNTPSGVGLAWLFGGPHRFTDWLEYSVVHAHPGKFLFLLAIVALSVGIGGILLARNMYGRNRAYVDGKDAMQRQPALAPIFNLSNTRLYWDEIYDAVFIEPFTKAGDFLANRLDWKWLHDDFHNNLTKGFQWVGDKLARPIDSGLIDGAVLGLGKLVSWSGSRMRRAQNGYVRTYAVGLLSGVVLLIIILLIPLFQNGG
jgi:NADH:ubiquinone oxidoreductase subunit 5 (subunit L)/multisubunit Na+/H+ antiporter MnhA subunit